jgi:predicted nucleotidyltransferase
MANFHSDEWIMEQLNRHYQEALTLFPEDRIVGVFLQGSQNYGLDYEGSDIDTKCIVLPTLEDLIFNRKPVSTTHVLPNEEHLDLKDVRLYFQTFRKQNLNFMEILFTKYKIVNPTYEPMWNRLIENNEQIARYNPVGAVKTMKGIALEKYHALEHRYPSKIELIDKYGYDPKQLSHLVRVHEYLKRYINGEAYADCLLTQNADVLIRVKRTDVLYIPLARAKAWATDVLDDVVNIADEFAAAHKDDPVDWHVDVLLDDVQRDIMKLGIELEMQKGE